MATLRDLELFDHKRGDEVAILVGPNGSGKSTFLRNLADSLRDENVIAVSNTPHDRFARMRGIQRISAGRSVGRNARSRVISRSAGLRPAFSSSTPIWNVRALRRSNRMRGGISAIWSGPKVRKVSSIGGRSGGAGKKNTATGTLNFSAIFSSCG